MPTLIIEISKFPCLCKIVQYPEYQTGTKFNSVEIFCYDRDCEMKIHYEGAQLEEKFSIFTLVYGNSSKITFHNGTCKNLPIMTRSFLL